MQTYGKKNQTVKEEECNLPIWKETKLRLNTKLRVPKITSVKTLDLCKRIPAETFNQDYQLYVKFVVLIY